MCDIGKHMHAISKFFARDRDANCLLCGDADEHRNGMDKRRLIHIVCPDCATVKKLHDKAALSGGIPVEIQMTHIGIAVLTLR